MSTLFFSFRSVRTWEEELDAAAVDGRRRRAGLHGQRIIDKLCESTSLLAAWLRNHPVRYPVSALYRRIRQSAPDIT